MGLTKLQIWNMALDDQGQDHLANLTTPNNMQRTLDTAWDNVFDSMLSGYDWAFARQTEDLVEHRSSRIHDTWAYEYEWPAECKVPRQVIIDGDDEPQSFEVRVRSPWPFPGEVTLGLYAWLPSGSGTDEYYVDAWFPGTQPDKFYENGETMRYRETEAGTLQAGEWTFDDNDAIGNDTIYVRLTNTDVPDPRNSIYVAGYFEEVFRDAPSTDARTILTDASDAHLIYTRNIDDTVQAEMDLLDPVFVQALSYALQSRIAMRATQDPTRQQIAAQVFRLANSIAETHTAKQRTRKDAAVPAAIAGRT